MWEGNLMDRFLLKLFRPFHLTSHFVFDVIVWLSSRHDDSSFNC